MGKTEINPVIMWAVGIVLVAVLVFFGYRASQPPTPPAGSYKPGVPPWLDPDNPNHGKIQAPPTAAQMGAPGAAGVPGAPAGAAGAH